MRVFFTMCSVMDNPCGPDAGKKRAVRVHLGQKGPAEVREGGQHRCASESRDKESWMREKGEGADQRRTANRRASAKGEQRRSKGWSNAKDKIEHQQEME